MKIRNGFVSNSSTSSFIIYDYHEDYELSSYEIIVGSECSPTSEEFEIFYSLAEEYGKQPNQNMEFEITVKDIPKTWEKYYSKWSNYLKMKVPLDLSFSDINRLIKQFNEVEENED